MKRHLIIACCMMLLIIPFQVKANEIEDLEITKYYKTITYENNDFVEQEIITHTTEISKEEYDLADTRIDLASTTSGSTETTYKKMTTSITKNGSFYRYKVVLDWKTVPKVRSYDIIGIGFHASVTATDIMHFSQTSCKSTDNCSTTTAYTQYKGANGVGASFNVTDGDIISLSQTLYVDVKKTNSSATIIKQYAYGDYAHAVKTISKNNAKNYNVGIDGIILSSGISDYYDSINTANATWTGTWWKSLFRLFLFYWIYY